MEYLFGPFRLDAASLQVWRGSDQIPLTPKAFDTLLVLVTHRDRLVRKDELMQAVWPNSFVSEDSLSQNITALRRALGDDPNRPEYIATVPRRGYRFVAPVAERGGTDTAAAIEAPPLPMPSGPAAAAPSPAPLAPPTGISGSRGRQLAIAGVVMAAIAAAAMMVATRATRDTTPPARPLRLAVEPPPGTRLVGGVLAPDGQQLALVVEDAPSGMARLCVRPMDSPTARTLSGTEGASRPFWSPDNRFIGFFANGRLKRVSVDGGPVQTVASTVGLTASGATWGPDGTILFSHFKSGVMRVPASGGTVTPLTTLDAGAREEAHRWPQFLTDGRHFLYSVTASTADRSGTYIASLDAPEGRRVLPEQGAIYAPPNHVVFVRDGLLMAQPFDVDALRLDGEPTTLAGEVGTPNPSNVVAVSASAGNLLAFSGGARKLNLAWFDRTGRKLGTVKAPASLTNPTVSGDQKHLVAGSGTDVWLVDLERDTLTRVVPGNTPLLSPDGARIAYTSGRLDGIADVYVRPTIGGTADDELLLRTPENKFVQDWSRDGRYVVYASANPRTNMDLWVLPTAGDRTPRPYLVTPYSEFHAQLSPDGRWMAYASDESGTWEVYIQSFPAPGGKRVVSSGGGSEPQWRGDGRELFYLAADFTLMSVAVTPGGDLQLKRPMPLFHMPPIAGEQNTRRNHFTVTQDGQRFLVNEVDNLQDSVTVLVNWTAALGR